MSIAYTTGLDWDGVTIPVGVIKTTQFEKQFTFTEENNQEGIQYQAITVTCTPVIGGNVRRRNVQGGIS